MRVSSFFSLSLFFNSCFSAVHETGDASADTSTTLKQVDLRPTIRWEHYRAGDGPVAPIVYTDTNGQPTATATEVYIPAITAIARQDVSLSFTISLQSNNESEYFGIEGFCWYPVSPYLNGYRSWLMLDKGFYGRLSRILFYTTMIFALFARRHQWLIVGALATSFTFSGTAAVHACIMIWSNSGMGNNDMYAILGILLFASAMTVPLLTWSKTIKDIGRSHEEESIGRSIIIAWGLLVFLGTVTIFVGTYVGRLSNNVGHGDYHVYSPALSTADSITCTPPNNELDLTAGQNRNWASMYLTHAFIERNGCTNPCAELMYPTIFKSTDSLVPLSTRQVDFWIENDTELERKKWTYFVVYALTLGGLAILFAILQALTVLLFGRRSSIEVRNTVYLTMRSLFMDHDGTADDDSNARHRMPSFFAKGFAYAFYAWSVAATIVSIILVAAAIVVTELMMSALPQSDEDFEVDQWGQWVAICLILLTAALFRFEGVFEDLLMRLLNGVMEGIHACIHRRHNNCEWHSHRNGEDARGLSNGSIIKFAFRDSLHHYWARLTSWPTKWQERWQNTKDFYHRPLETANKGRGKMHQRARKVVNLEGQKFPDEWDGDDWLQIDEFVDMCRKCDFHRKDSKNSTGKGYKWQPRVIPDDGVTDAIRTTFNRRLFLDLFSRHKTRSQAHKSEVGINIRDTTTYTKFTRAGKDVEPDSDDDGFKDQVTVTDIPLGSLPSSGASPPRLQPEPLTNRMSGHQFDDRESSQSDALPLLRSDTAPASQLSAARYSSSPVGISPYVVPVRHATTFQAWPLRHSSRQRSISTALAPIKLRFMPQR